MAIKKTTAVKKSDPPKKKWNPDSMITGKTFAKVLKPGQKSDTYYYMKGTPGGGQGGIKNASKSLQYKSNPNISEMVNSQRTVAKPKKTVSSVKKK